MDPDDGISWISTPVTIRVPIKDLAVKSAPNAHWQPFVVSGFHHRSLVNVIKAKLEDPSSQEHFHTLGHELWWQPGGTNTRTRIHGEIYTSDAFLTAYNDLQVSLNPDLTRFA